ncbi:AsmA-like C-terminal region-containing protein [Salegentibacter salegens]|uniref:AsmA-like C-terminal region n=1 Tax=Salegentibacter salegens TaxID=143223 RepID=A0A1M7I5M1_9FLAO|nr:AsmA-like C-terminal region-containing protein [Salegentibacter salegens]PRX42848.1 AsmA-like protein [Salegentibacter salegens]SHM35717.1 AsmA-like C-terminal region [Salegentibacter salegens]
MKKVFKIIGIVLLVIVVILVVAPFLFESQIKDYVRKTANESVDAQVEFSDISLSFFRSFPQATVVIENFSVINNEPFKGDTLAIGEEAQLEMSIKELFKGADEPKVLDDIKLNNTFLNIKVDSLGNANYDIAIQDTTAAATDSASTGFSFDLKHYEINNSRVKYLDVGQKLLLDVEELNHQGTGDFSLAESELDTESTALVSLDYDGVNYLNRNKVSLDAVIQMDLKNMRYTFLENEAMINQLPLTFEGFVQVNEDNNEIDLSFQTPSSDFKNFLAVIPATYAKNIENVETNGDFIVNGKIQGIVDDTYIPKMDIKVSSNNASFKYPDLPKSVEDINIDLQILNETGILEDTYLTFDNVTFRIDQDRFATNGSVKNLMGNMLVDMALKGTLNLANLEQAYPLELEQDLNGVLTADLTTQFDMNSIEKEQYQNVKSSGTASLRNFSYKSPEIPNEVKIANATMNFNQGNVRVPELKLTTGQTDINASGNIENLMGFLFTEQNLKGNFNVNSNVFAINDFMIAEAETDTKETPGEISTPSSNEAVKIPSFLDTEIAFNVNTVIYDNLELKNATGTIILRDETATLQNITTNIFGGNITLAGNVSTKGATPTFDMDLALNALNIAESFNGLEMLQGLAPVAQALQGKLQTNLKLNGNLNEDLTPQLSTLAGNALAEILTAEINPEKLALLSRLDQQLDFINFKDIDLDKLKTRLTFSDGMVQIEPFNFNVEGVNVEVSGSHGFDMNMNYNLNLDVPARMLGSQVGNALSKLSGDEIRNMMVALPIGLKGTFQNPQINVNMQQAVTNLTQRIVAKQKENLQERGQDAIRDIINKQTGNRNQQQQKPDTTAVQDSTQTQAPKTEEKPRSQEEEVKDAAKDILGGILRKSKKKKDTTSN